MVRITEELIRKRAEHNEGIIFSLEELTLHQLDIERLENIDKWCPNLKILYLHSNLISKIENINRLKKLQYLNLTLNNITCFENLSGCESLRKLDLTLNFIKKLSSISELKENYNLEELYLTGNPCSTYEGYRKFVIVTLPQLKVLDGKTIEHSERIQAQQEYEMVQSNILIQECESMRNEYEEMDDQITATNKLEPDSFWSQPTSHTPQTRMRIYEELQKRKLEEKVRSTSMKAKKSIKKLVTDDGRILNINEPKVSFQFINGYDNEDDEILLDVSVYKYLDTSLIKIELNPTYIQIRIREKLLQLSLPAEINPDQSSIQRSETTGHLLVRMPKAQDLLKSKKNTEQPRGEVNKPLDQSQTKHPNTGLNRRDLSTITEHNHNIAKPELKFPVAGTTTTDNFSEIPDLV